MGINLKAEIRPHKGAGGFVLGTMISEIKKEVLSQFERKEIHNKYLPNHPPLIEYTTKEIILHFYENKLNQIGMIGNYAGKLHPNLGIGSIVSQFEKHYGKMIEGDEDELKFSNLNGLCFEVDSQLYNSDNWRTVVPNLPVSQIYVFGKEIYNYKAHNNV